MAQVTLDVPFAALLLPDPLYIRVPSLIFAGYPPVLYTIMIPENAPFAGFFQVNTTFLIPEGAALKDRMDCTASVPVTLLPFTYAVFPLRISPAPAVALV
jgi:hypothetical protein